MYFKVSYGGVGRCRSTDFLLVLVVIGRRSIFEGILCSGVNAALRAGGH